jgi:6-phosphogluconolactonase (cycloisomerase 2 family)
MGRNALLYALLALAAAACAPGDGGPDSPTSVAPLFSSLPPRAGGVYVMTNGAAGNQVRMYERSTDGSLGGFTAYPTGGTGTGAGLGSQGALTLSDDGKWLLAVNAGSNDVSVFRVDDSGLALTDREPSGGTTPISVTVSGSLVYVLNGGGTNNITGFALGNHGQLTQLAGSSRPLSAASPGPAQVEFTPDGDQLVVTEKGTNRILTYDVGRDGRASQPTVRASAGATPFGFAFVRNDVLAVSEAFGGAANASAVSTYSMHLGSFELVSASVPTTETAACWAVATRNGRFVYVTNTGSGTVSGYSVANDGALALLDADGVTGVTGGAPIDAALSQNSQFLYVLAGGVLAVRAFAVGADGSLTPVGGAAGLPAGSVGIAAR